MTAQVNKKELPRRKCLYDYPGVTQHAIPATQMVSFSGGSNARGMAQANVKNISTCLMPVVLELDDLILGLGTSATAGWHAITGKEDDTPL